MSRAGAPPTGSAWASSPGSCNEGHADGVDLGGLAAAFVIRYDDDEPGSPWSFVVHVDERGSEEQREALAAILTGRLGGDDVLRLPWARKPSEELRASSIQLWWAASQRAAGRLGKSGLTATRQFPTEERVSCVIPGHHIAGTEYYADRLAVHDEPFEWELEGNCAFVCTFSYSG